LKIKRVRVLDNFSEKEVNAFIQDKEVEELIPVITREYRNGKIVNEFFSCWIVHWWEDEG